MDLRYIICIYIYINIISSIVGRMRVGNIIQLCECDNARAFVFLIIIIINNNNMCAKCATDNN